MKQDILPSGRILFYFLLLLVAGISSCRDNDMKSVEGSWQGTGITSDLKVTPGATSNFVSVPHFKSIVKFKKDNVLTVEDGGITTSGTWSQDGERLSIAINFTYNNINLAGGYTVLESNNSVLRIHTERGGIFTNRNGGNNLTSGTAGITWSFKRIP
jgi:hypothetical protein